MIITVDSHLDHDITGEQLAWILAECSGHREFFIETLEIPTSFGVLECGLHGPAMGDDPVPADDCFYRSRGDREYGSRMCNRLPRETHLVTVIGGPHPLFEGDVVEPITLFTVFGGPAAPKEPGDPTINNMEDLAKSRDFWSQHALSSKDRSGSHI
jgi:hypothetical protein